LVDFGLEVTFVIANFHHRRIIPLMERELCIFEMSNTANPMSLACSQLLQEQLPKRYVATRARHAVNLKVEPHNNDDLWSFVMLPDTGPESTTFLFPFVSLLAFFACADASCL
jgi:hypothetical protein